MLFKLQKYPNFESQLIYGAILVATCQYMPNILTEDWHGESTGRPAYGIKLIRLAIFSLYIQVNETR